MDRLDDSCSLASLGYLDRNELTIPSIPTDLARLLLSHLASPSFLGLLTRHIQAAGAVLGWCTMQRGTTTECS